MIVVNDSSSEVQITTSATADIHYYFAVEDISAGKVIDTSPVQGAITSATTTSIFGPAYDSRKRKAKYISLANVHASTSNDVTVIYYDGTNSRTIAKFTIVAGGRAQYTESTGFRLFDASGAQQ